MTDFTVELRICGEQLEPHSVTERLGIVPTMVRLRGESRGTEMFTDAVWAFDGRMDDTEMPTYQSLETGLCALMDRIESVKPQIIEYAAEYEVMFWCGHFISGWNSCYRISPVVLGRMCDFGAELYVDSYSDGDEDASARP